MSKERARAAFEALQESFGLHARFTRISEIPDQQQTAYYRFGRFLNDALKAAGDPLLTKDMCIDSFIGLHITRGSGHWRAEGWMILFDSADVWFSAIFQDGAASPRCQFRPAAKRRMEHDHELGEYDFFAFKSGAG